MPEPTPRSTSPAPADPGAAPPSEGPLALPPAAPARVVAGGFLMGFANLVPGISGGTMILAVGLYERFVSTLAELSRLRFTGRNLRFCALLALGLLVAVLTLSEVLVDLVVSQRWVMYSLFVGMTLGGVPPLVRACRPLKPDVLVSALAGLAGMVGVAFQLRDVALPEHPAVLVAVGAVCAMSMILPGISGSYLLLVFGLYETVIGSLSSRALKADLSGSLWILGPVVLGAGLGIVSLSRGLERLLVRAPRGTHAVLLGLLLGSVLGLYPFQRPVDPELADRATRKAVQEVLAGEAPAAALERTGAELDEARLRALVELHAGAGPADLKREGEALEVFSPRVAQVLGCLGLLVAGAAITHAFGRRPRPASGSASEPAAGDGAD